MKIIGDNSEEIIEKLCDNELLMNDGICDDKSNTYQCNFDGGDCCKDDTIKDFCLLCQCFSKYFSGNLELVFSISLLISAV